MFVFPVFLLEAGGIALIYQIRPRPRPEKSGVISAVFVCALQTVGASGLVALLALIQTGIEGGLTSSAGL